MPKVQWAPAIKRALDRAGALAAWHRRRNRDWLTVIALHRVLPPSDARWATADPEYTLSTELFAACLAFFRAHYAVVSLDDVLAARAGTRRLPPCPLLITLDDGWADSAEYAMPALREAGLPAVLFVAGDAVGRGEPFWQEALIAAWRGGRLERGVADALWRTLTGAEGAGPFDSAGPDHLAPIRVVIERLEKLDAPSRDRHLAALRPAFDRQTRQMITIDQLRGFAAGGIAIGSHGQTHAPLTEVDAGAEVTAARRTLEPHLGGAAVTTMSFPHSKLNDAVVAQARAAGYQLMFAGESGLSPARLPDDVIGRVGFTGETITGRDGKFAPELLALRLFRLPHAGEAGLRHRIQTAVRRTWMKYALRGVRQADAHRRLDLAYQIRDPWKMESPTEQFRFAETNRIVHRALVAPAAHLGTILEIGAGEGHQSAHLARLCERLTGIDVSATAIARARERVPGAELIAGDLLQQPWVGERARYDLVTAFEVLYYMKDIPRMIETMSRLGRACAVSYFEPSAKIVEPALRSIAGLEEDRFRFEDVEWRIAWWRNP